MRAPRRSLVAGPVLASVFLAGAVLTAAAGCSDPVPPPPTRAAPATALPAQLPPGSDSLQSALEQIALPGTAVHAFDDLLVLALDNRIYEAELLADTRSGMSAVDAVTRPDIDIVIGSGFVRELNSLQPVGLLQVDGRVLSEVQPHGYTRILGIADDGFGVVHRSAYERNRFASAIQVGPGIVEQGRLDISERDLERPRFFRSFVATCDAQTLIGISLVPLNLYTVGRSLTRELPALGLLCDEVVNLAGDREAILAAQSPVDSSIVYHGHPNTHKVALLGFRALRRTAR